MATDTNTGQDKWRAFYESMMNRYGVFDGKKLPDEVFDDRTLLYFMLHNNVEFFDHDDYVIARAFLKERAMVQLPKSSSWTGWTPYGKGRTRFEALQVLVANASDLELREEYDRAKAELDEYKRSLDLQHGS